MKPSSFTLVFKINKLIRQIHIETIVAYLPNVSCGFRVPEEKSSPLFTSLFEVVKHYNYCLKSPVNVNVEGYFERVSKVI